LIFSIPAGLTVVDNVTDGERHGIPWPSDNAEHFEAGNHTCNRTATGGPDPMCYGNRLESVYMNSDTLKNNKRKNNFTSCEVIVTAVNIDRNKYMSILCK
jgi:hypothetical protein